MDWNWAVEKQRQALLRVVAMLVEMAGLPESVLAACSPSNAPAPDITPTPDRSSQGEGEQPRAGASASSPLRGGVRGGGDDDDPGPNSCGQPDPRRAASSQCIAPAENAPAFTLPRHLYRAILALLRPAEAAARRLILVAARKLLTPLSIDRSVQPGPVRAPLLGKGIPIWKLGLANVAPPPPRKPVQRPPVFQLIDTLRGLPRTPRAPAQSSMPRISGFDADAPRPAPLPPRPSSNDLVDAGGLRRRFAALVLVLNDLPAQTRRRARQAAAVARGATGRLWWIRPGPPPGWLKPGSRRRHQEHKVLEDTNGLAFWSLQEPDTS